MNLPWYIGLRYTWTRRKSRSVAFLSAVSMAGLAVGIALLFLVLSVMNGFDRELRERILGLVPQAAIYHSVAINDWRELREGLEAQPDIIAAAPFVQLEGLVSVRQEAEAIALWGIDPEAEARVSLIDRFIPEDVQARMSQLEPIILLGNDIARRLDVQVGDRVMVIVAGSAGGFRSPRVEYLEVAHLVQSKTQLDDTLALTSLHYAARLSGNPLGVSGLRLRVADLFDAPRIAHRSAQEQGPLFYAIDWTQTHWNLYQAIRMSKNLVALLMSMIVAIAAFNVISALVLVVIDKQGDIAILRTMGLSGGKILAVFVTQGALIGVAGTLAGLGIGIGLALVAQPFVAGVEQLFGVRFLESDVYPLTYLPTEIRVRDILHIAATSLIICLLATLYPAWKAARVRPAEALRYE